MPTYRRPRVFIEFTSLQDLTAVAGHAVFLRSNVAIGCYLDWRYAYDSTGLPTATIGTDASDLGAALGRCYQRHAAVFAGHGITLGNRFFCIWQAMGSPTPVGSNGIPGSFPLCQGLFWHQNDKPYEKYKRFQFFQLRNVGSSASGTFSLRIRIGSTDYTVSSIAANVSVATLTSTINAAIAGSGYTFSANVPEPNDANTALTLNVYDFHCGFYAVSGNAENTSVLVTITAQSLTAPAYVQWGERTHGTRSTDYTFPYPYPRNFQGIEANKPLVEDFLDGWEAYRSAHSLPHCQLIQMVSEAVAPELTNLAYNLEGDNNSSGWWLDFQKSVDYVSLDARSRIDGVQTIKEFFDAGVSFSGGSMPPYNRDSGTVGTFQIYRQPANNEPMGQIYSIVQLSCSQSRKKAIIDPIRERYVGMRLGEYTVYTQSRSHPFVFRPSGGPQSGNQHHLNGKLPGHDCSCQDCYQGMHEWIDQGSPGIHGVGRGERWQWAAHFGIADPTTDAGKRALNARICQENLVNNKKANPHKLNIPYMAKQSPGTYTASEQCAIIKYCLQDSEMQCLDGVHWFAPGNAAAVNASLDQLEAMLAQLESEVSMSGDGSWAVDVRGFMP